MAILKLNAANPGVKRPLKVEDLADLWTGIETALATGTDAQPRIIWGFKVDNNDYTAGIIAYKGKLYVYDAVSEIISVGDTVYGTQVSTGDNRVLGDGTTQLFSYAQRCTLTAAGNVLIGELSPQNVANWKAPDGLPSSFVTTDMIAPSAITGAKIADGTITGAKIATATITGAKLDDGAITNPKIAAGAVTSRTIQDNSIVTSKILDDTIVDAKLSAGTPGHKWVANHVANSSGTATLNIDRSTVYAIDITAQMPGNLTLVLPALRATESLEFDFYIYNGKSTDATIVFQSPSGTPGWVTNLVVSPGSTHVKVIKGVDSFLWITQSIEPIIRTNWVIT